MGGKALLRVFVALTTFAVVWLVVTPARAADHVKAPICDPRGAIAFAPPPQMQEPEQSLDIVVNEDDCTESPLAIRHVVPHEHRAPGEPGGSGRESIANTAPLVWPGPVAERLRVAKATRSSPLPGFESSLERPPR